MLLWHRHILLQWGRGPAVVAGWRRISHRPGHVARSNHATTTGILWLDRIVCRSGIRTRVRIVVHWLLGHLLGVLLLMSLVIVVALMVLVVMRPTSPTWLSSTATTCSSSGPRTYTTSSLHALPSRQMPLIVHHAGLGVVEVRWLITDVMATAIQASYGRQRIDL